MTHTPGPWYWVKYPTKRIIRLMGAKQLSVMDFVRWGAHSAQPRFVKIAPSGMEIMVKAEDIAIEENPNARLIAAAPEMYEALLEIHKAFISGELLWKHPRKSDTDPYHAAVVKMTAAIAKAEGQP